MKRKLTATLAIPILLSCSEPVEYDLVVSNVGLFDGFEDRGVVDLAINDGTIAAISSTPLAGDSVIDGTGK